MHDTSDMSLVPTRRLGQLLMDHRVASDVTTTEVAGRLSFLPTPNKVTELESGLLVLSDDQVEEVVDAYGVSLATLVPQRSKLALDLEGWNLSAVAQAGVAALDELLGKYLSTVRALRSLPDNTEIALRDADLRTLSTGLVMPLDDVRNRLHELMDARPDEIREQAELMLGRPLIPMLGILVGATGIGSLILAPPNAKPVPARRRDDGNGSARATNNGDSANVDWADRDSESRHSVEDISEVKNAALELISYDYRRFLPGWIVEFWPAQSDRRGRTHGEDKRIEVYVGANQTPQDVAHAVAYELGRAVDTAYNDGSQRLQWLSLRGIGNHHPWLNGDGEDDLTVGSGDFADSFAHWQSGGQEMRSDLAGPPDGEQLNLLAELSFGQST